ncbi:MAG: ribosome recycling factor [Ichthyobacteriaceae bacterium]|nr:ribosome recycling factor [Ichthyobacteriaceae bacterium]
MEEEVSLVVETAQEEMQSAIEHLKKQFVNIRAGKASPVMLNSVVVDYYGSMTPLAQVANVNTPDGRTLSIQPWEKAMIDPIERAIINSNLGFAPMNNGDAIIISIPPLTEERRRDLAKQAKSETEKTKVVIRNYRKDANGEIKTLEKDGLGEDAAKDAEATIQNLTHKFSKVADELEKEKAVEIMTV